MGPSRTFPRVTRPLLERIRAETRAAYTITDDPGGHSGLVTAASPIGAVIVRFEYAVEREEITVTILEKPFMLPATLLWAGMSHALDRMAREIG